MEVSTFCTSFKHEVDVEFKCTRMDESYNGTTFSLMKRIQILDYYHGLLAIVDKKLDDLRRELKIVCYISKVKKANGILHNFNAELLNKPIKVAQQYHLKEQKGLVTHTESGEEKLKDVLYGAFVYPTNSSDTAKLTNLSGTVTVSFEACKGQIRKQSLIQGFSNLNQNYTKTYLQKISGTDRSKSNENIKLICGDVTQVFDKAILCSISDVFDAMFSNPNNIECRNGAVYLEEVDPLTILGFGRLLTSHIVKEEDLNVSMLLFADRYNIQPIFQLCLDHLKKNITLENFPEIAKASDLITNNGLFQAAVEFASQNLGKFDNNPDVKNFIRANPECFAKVFENMIFKK